MEVKENNNSTKSNPTIFDFFKEIKKIREKQARELLIIEEILIQQNISNLQQ